MDNEILKLIELGEGYHLELKESLDKSFIEEVCAFANSSGGKIILGISDNGEIKGMKTDNTFRSKIQDILKQIEPRLEVDIIINGNIIIINVPKGKEKPYGCSKGFFVRVGPNCQKLTRNEIVSFFQKEGQVRFDELENRKADFDGDFNQNTFDNFLQITGISPAIEKNLYCITLIA